MESTTTVADHEAILGCNLNSRLDARNQEIVLELATNRLKEMANIAWPLVGDVVLWPNGETRRVSHDWGESFQTSRKGAGSFYALSNGHGSFSGSLQDAQLREFFELTDEVTAAQFWFFSHNRSGAGRGVQCSLPCRVWRLMPYERTFEQAKMHSVASQSAEVWGEGHIEHQRRIESIMKPRVMTDPANS